MFDSKQIHGYGYSQLIPPKDGSVHLWSCLDFGKSLADQTSNLVKGVYSRTLYTDQQMEMVNHALSALEHCIDEYAIHVSIVLVQHFMREIKEVSLHNLTFPYHGWKGTVEEKLVSQSCNLPSFLRKLESLTEQWIEDTIRPKASKDAQSLSQFLVDALVFLVVHSDFEDILHNGARTLSSIE